MGLRAWLLGKLWDVGDDCLEHSCYGLDLVGKSLKSSMGWGTRRRREGVARLWLLRRWENHLPYLVVRLLQEKTFVGGEGGASL
ncbi:hypothetical protein GW17_00042079 [Ensete ventricosum]|nr:hypothetical protein GW17_00042079 [Ensete ventricosum]RZS02483.1 hypothetical protein BHM03_00032544 [Ensete ventricosum]